MTEIRDVLKTAFINFDLSATEKKAAISELAGTFEPSLAFGRSQAGIQWMANRFI